jgi:disulfide bond formation protein DsbB
MTAIDLGPPEAVAMDDFWDFITSWYFLGLSCICLAVIVTLGTVTIVFLISRAGSRDEERRRRREED